ncbi:MAG: hypothetical protein ABI686_02735 [Acidobacteriota bacterium]
MMARSLICLLLFIFPFHVFAQETDDAAKEKQRHQVVLVNQILSDIPTLKLGENRAYADAKVGNLVWKTDEKLARTLFQSAVGELINAQNLAEADTKNTNYQYALLNGQNIRPQILTTIASRDAELALDYLVKTRPANITKALLNSSVKSSKIKNSNNNYANLVQTETNLEQSFIRLAADQNPERAVKLLKESLKKGLSEETLSLLKKLYAKDAEAANEIASEIVAKLIQKGFDSQNQNYSQNANVAISFLSEFIREKNETEKYIKFDSSQMQTLADKLISYALQTTNRYGNGYAYSMLPIAEKLSPGSVAQIKQMQNVNVRRSWGWGGYDPEVTKLLSNGDTTAEMLLGTAAKVPERSRSQIYQMAANKFAQQGDLNRATEVLNDNFSDDALEEMLRNLNYQYSYNLINAGKFAEAERLIDGFPENTRLSALINLANAIYQKNPEENKSYAVSVLGKARSSIAYKPEDSNEMSMLMQIISAYALIEPSEAFRIFESLTPQINELSEAAAITYGFQKSSNVKGGEFVITNGNSLGVISFDPSIFKKLAEKDFDRTMNLINSFSRHENQVALKMQLAEGILN